jgi:hypothetical protein
VASHDAAPPFLGRKGGDRNEVPSSGARTNGPGSSAQLAPDRPPLRPASGWCRSNMDLLPPVMPSSSTPRVGAPVRCAYPRSVGYDTVLNVCCHVYRAGHFVVQAAHVCRSCTALKQQRRQPLAATACHRHSKLRSTADRPEPPPSTSMALVRIEGELRLPDTRT